MQNGDVQNMQIAMSCCCYCYCWVVVVVVIVAVLCDGMEKVIGEALCMIQTHVNWH